MLLLEERADSRDDSALRLVTGLPPLVAFAKAVAHLDTSKNPVSPLGYEVATR